MDTYLKNFGPRLRAYVERRGTIESAYAAIGVSRATLFNWFNRDTPPPGDEKVARLKKYLGKDADWILDGVQENSQPLEEGQSRYEPHPMRITPGHEPTPREPTEQELLDFFLRTLSAAKQVPGGRGYIYLQLKKHLNPDEIEKLKD